MHIKKKKKKLFPRKENQSLSGHLRILTCELVEKKSQKTHSTE